MNLESLQIQNVVVLVHSSFYKQQFRVADKEFQEWKVQ